MKRKQFCSLAIFVVGVACLLHADDPTSRLLPLAPLNSSLPASSTGISVQMEVWDQATSGSMVFSEAHTVDTDGSSKISNDSGFADLLLGRGVAGGLDPAKFPPGSTRYLDVTQGGLSVLVARVPLYASAFTIWPGGSVTSVTAGDGSITIGGVPSINPSVAVAFGGIGPFQIAPGTVIRSLNGLTDGVGLLGANGLSVQAAGGNLTVSSNATPNNTASTIVSRDAAGNFAAGTVALSGNLALPNTTNPAVGVITFGGAPFLHNFGNFNTFVGASAGNLALTGQSNAGFGSKALQSNTTGSSNSAFGDSALLQNTTGVENAAFGWLALDTNTTASFNSAFGTFALNHNVVGNLNSAFGERALLNNLVDGNSAFGANALRLNLTGDGNSAFGTESLSSNSTGLNNSAFGYGALQHNTGHSNSAFGTLALQANTSANGNAAFGTRALQSNTTGTANDAFGFGALQNNTTGNSNSAFGDFGLSANTIGIQNAAFGSNALHLNTAGRDNAAFGFNALAANTSDRNSAFGSQALGANTGGASNAAFGSDALGGNANGFYNNAFGDKALVSDNSDTGNNAFGTFALQNLTSGNYNVAIGYLAGGTLTSGSNNVLISGDIPSGSGSNNIVIGGSGGGGNNTIVIGSGLSAGAGNNLISIGASGALGNTIRIGTTQSAAFIAGISTAAVAGSQVAVSNSGQLGVLASSRRFKQEIADLGAESDILMKLRPVAFYYKPDLDDTHTRQYGLVAEEVAAIAPNLVVFDDDGKPQTVRYHFVNAMLLNEVQKQRGLIETQREELAAQKQQIEHLTSVIEAQQAARQAEMNSLRDQVEALSDLLHQRNSSLAQK